MIATSVLFAITFSPHDERGCTRFIKRREDGVTVARSRRYGGLSIAWRSGVFEKRSQCEKGLLQKGARDYQTRRAAYFEALS
jgi:hypothetical protein